MTPSTLTFAKQTVGVPSAAQNFSVTNTGSANLTITLVASTNSAEFPISSDGCAGATLTPQQQFNSNAKSASGSPTLGGNRSGTITVTDNATGSPQIVTLTGTGYGTPMGSLNPTTLSFGSQNIGVTSGALTSTLSNPGTDVLNVAGFSVVGTDAGEFNIARVRDIKVE